jgi:Arm DNA-binding domain
MALTDTRTRNAKPTSKPFKLSDRGGMYLLIKPDGARYWRLDYRFAGKRRTFTLGIYPIVSLHGAFSSRRCPSIAGERH